MSTERSLQTEGSVNTDGSLNAESSLKTGSALLGRVLQLSIERRWLVVLLTLVAAAVGVHSLTRLPIDAVPDITNKQVQVNTLLAAFSPIEIEKQVTFPIETALAGIPGLNATRSLSRNGFSQVTAIFDDDVDIYFARSQVNERLGAARERLPRDAEPTMGPIATGLSEIYMWTVEYEPPHASATPASAIEPGRQPAGSTVEPGWQSDGAYLTPEGQTLRTDVERAAYLRTVQDWIIAPQLKGVPGVAGIDAIGGYVKQYHVAPDPMKLVSYGLSFHDLIEALERNNASTGAGTIEHAGEAYVVRASGRLEREDEIATIVVGTRGGVPIRVRDVASVGLGKELLRTGSAGENGEEVVVGTALMLIGANSRTVARAVDARMHAITRTLPPGIKAKTVLDRTKLVDATIGTVQTNLLEGALLVIVILFALLGNFRAALITALAIPLSMLLTATGMVQTRTSGNLMSLGAIDFGLIVDGAVIIVENCLRRLAERQRALGRKLVASERLHEVALAAKEMIQPTVYGQAIIITVYLPILTLTGVEGKMFQPMALTVIMALVAAFVLSLTFVPAMVAICISGRVAERENFLLRWSKRAYEPVVGCALRARVAVVAGAAVAFALAALLFTQLGAEFVPTLDEQDIALHAMRIPSTGLAQSTRMQLDVERTISRFPEVKCVFSKTGTAEMASDPMPPNVSDTFVMLAPRKDWPDPTQTKDQLIRRIETALDELPGNSYEFTQPIQMRFNELIAGVRSDVAVKVFGDDFAQLERSARAIAAALRDVPGAEAVKVEQTEGLPVMTIDIDREAIARHGLSIADVQDVIAAGVGGRAAGQIFEGDRRFDVVVRLPEELRTGLDDLHALPIPLAHDGARSDGASRSSGSFPMFDGDASAPNAASIPLSSIARIQIADGPNQVSRENGKRRVVVQANVRGRDLESFVEKAQARVAGIALPAGLWVEWGGQFENLVAARERLAVVVPACFALIFLLLYSSFGSVRQALLVFSGVPLGLTGGVVALWLRGMPFSISAAIGFIALSGVAVLNGVVMVSFINQLRHEGASLDDAIRRGSLTRLRPVLMTALVASFGFVPMALATGTGAEVQKPLATVVIGGLVSSTLLTLVVLPALYRIFERVRSQVPFSTLA